MRRPRAKTLKLAAVTVASAAVTAACGVSNASDSGGLAAGPSGTPITVGISEPLSGPAQAQGFEADGQACLKGYQLWASDVNSHGGLLGRPVKLIVMNDRGWPASAEYDYRWLITHDHVDLTLAPFSSLLTALGADPATKKLGYAIAAGSAGAPIVFAAPTDPDLFSTTIPVASEMVPFANWVVHLPGHPLTAAYPMVNDPFADPPVQTTMNFFQSHGIKTVYAAPHATSTTGNAGYTDVSNKALTADARAVVKSDPGIVVLGSVDVPTVEAFMHEFGVLHFTPKIFIAASGPDQGQAFLDAAGTGNAIGMMVPDGWYGGTPIALSHVMVQDYIAKYGGTASDINADVAESYSAGEVMAAAVEATHGTVQSRLISWLHHNTIQTVVGPAKFNSVGENTLATRSAVVFQWQPGAGGTGADFVQVLPKPPYPGSVTILPTKAPLSG
jgi:branched-chain amino acid transport system substrate-binding protein